MVTRPPGSSPGSVPHERQHRSPGATALAVPPGTLLIGTYEIMEHLNTGGMGEVYRGVNIHNDEVVAIKIVLPALAHDEKILSLFQKESTVLRRIAHDAIVRYEVFTRDPALDRPCLIMEYAEGPSLGDRLEQAPLSLGDVLVLLRRLTSGLDVAHRGGVVHRDLSPDNVILCGDDVAQAKIIDFGIAKASAPGGRTLIGGQFAGKPGYVAPEQLGLYEGHVTGQADIYSLGLLAAAAALGHPLDMGDSPAAAVMARVKVPDLTGIDPELVPLLEWMLQPDPAHRPGSMAEINAWIMTHYADLVTQADPDQGMGPITMAPQPQPQRSQSSAPGSAPGTPQTAPPDAATPPLRPSRPPQPAAYQPTILADRPPMPPTAQRRPDPEERPEGGAVTDPVAEPGADPISRPPETVSIAPGTAPDDAPGSAPETVTTPPATPPPASQPPLSQRPVADPPVTDPPVTTPPVTTPPDLPRQATAPPPMRTQPPMTETAPPQGVAADIGAQSSASPFGPGPVTAPPSPRPSAVAPDKTTQRAGLPVLPIAAALGLVLIGGGVWMSGLLQSDPAPQIATAPPQAPGPEDDPEPEATVEPEPAPEPVPEPVPPPQPAPPAPQVLQAWLDARILSGPPTPCSWLPRDSTVAGLRGFADSPAAFAPLQADFEAEFDQPLPLRQHPLSAAQCPAFARIAALEQGQPASGQLGFTLPDQLVRGADTALEGQVSGQVRGELTVLMIDPAGRVQNITDLIEGGRFRLSGQRITPPEDAIATGDAPAVFALLALDTVTALSVMRALPGNAILPSSNAAEFWRFLGQDLDALPEPADFAHGIVTWSE